MKIKKYAALFAFATVFLLVRSSVQAVADSKCPGSGNICATSTDGTTYFKGSSEEQF